MPLQLKIVTCLLAVVLGGMAISAHATATEASIAVLDFELKDLTPDPNTPAELERTASIGPLLRKALDDKDGFDIVDIDPAAQAAADKGAGYLFERTEVAAQLGQQAGADYIAVGRLHKPSFLFAYLKVHLIDVKNKTLIGDYIVEVKGTVPKITDRGVGHLADKIEQTLAGS